MVLAAGQRRFAQPGYGASCEGRPRGSVRGSRVDGTAHHAKAFIRGLLCDLFKPCILQEDRTPQKWAASPLAIRQTRLYPSAAKTKAGDRVLEWAVLSGSSIVHS